VALADDFQQVLDSLPGDWTDIVCDLRLDDEAQYVDAAVLLTQVNAQPYSQADWHFRINVAHSFGHAAAAETVTGTLRLFDEQGIGGELIVRDVREGARGTGRGRADVGPARVGQTRVSRAPLALGRASGTTRPAGSLTSSAAMTEANWFAITRARLISTRLHGRCSER
jgi:hypothetical protein